MNRSMLILATLPISLLLTACPSDDGPSGTADDETGITTAGDGDGDPTGDGDGDPTGDGDGDGDGDSGDGDGGPSCGMVQIAPEYTPPNVMLLVDASGSMIDNEWDHDLDPNTMVETRWKTLHAVVTSVMNQFGSSMNAGLQRFPGEGAQPVYGPGSCVVSNTPEVSIAFDNGAAILAAMPSADDEGASIHGGTPATHGMDSAVAHLMTQPPDLARYILLITDGAANCTPGLTDNQELMEIYDETLLPTVQAARNDHNITTFVVGIDIVNELIGTIQDGIPEANPFERLNEIAVAGGAPKNMGLDAEKFFNATNQDELLTALGFIIDDITECVIDLSKTEEGVPEANQIPYISFEADGMTVPGPVDDCENEDGWAWLEEGVIVTFCGSYCDDFKTGGAVFDGTYGCPPPE